MFLSIYVNINYTIHHRSFMFCIKMYVSPVYVAMSYNGIVAYILNEVAMFVLFFPSM